MMNGNARILTISLILGLVVFLVLGLVLFLFTNGSIGRPSIMVLIVLIIVANLAVVGASAWKKQSKQQQEAKAKRNLNMYQVIDRLIEDLTPDEAIYLEQLIDDAYGEVSFSDEASERLEDEEPKRLIDVMQKRQVNTAS